MEQRVRNLEDLCELITKEIVEQNKSMIEMNKNLINEIKCLREAYVKQDHDFEDFKNLLQKLYEQNRQSVYANIMPPAFPPNMQMLPNFNPNQQQQPPQNLLQPPQYPSQPQTISAASSVNTNLNLLNQSGMMSDQAGGVNQSMINNLSFQSERTPFNQNRTLNLNGTMPSSASALNQNLNKQQQQQPQQLPPQFGSGFNLQQQQHQPPLMGNVAAFNPNQPPPLSFSNINNNLRPQQQQQQQLSSPPKQQTNVPLRFAPPQNTTSTPQQLNPSQQLKQPQQPVLQQQATSSTTTNKPPLFQLSPAKPLNDATNKPAPVTTTSLFGSNLFKTAPINILSDKTIPSTSVTSANLMGGSLFKAPQPTTLMASNQEDGEDNENDQGGNPEEYEPQVDFKPIVKLNKVEVKSGEEDEEVLLKQRCKLFRFDNNTKEWKEKGLGDIKILKNKETGVTRVLMRREHVLKICANHRITSELKINEISSKQMSWVANDFSDNESKSELLLAKFKTDEEAIKFKNEFESAVVASKSIKPSTTKPSTNTIASNKPGLNELLKTDNWQCIACYAPNKKEMTKCACCQAPKPGSTTQTTQEQTNKPPLFGFGVSVQPTAPTTQANSNLFAFGNKPIEKPVATNTTVKFDFGSKENPPKSASTTFQPFSPMTSPSKNTTSITNATNVSPSKGVSNLFGGTLTATTSLFGAQTLTNTLPTFNSLASKSGNLNEKCFGNADSSAAASASIFKPFGFGGGLQPAAQPKPLFGGAASLPTGASPASQTANNNNEENEDGGNENQNPEDYEPQVDFKPLVKLEEVEVKTGEEDEDVLFKARCKLYRFIAETKEWKEKGAGEIKVLKRKETTNVFRILMRRDQIFKLCANHRITSDIKLEIVNEKQVRWHAQDYSEPGEGKHELLTAKFRHDDEAKQFKAEVEKAQVILASEPSIPQTDTNKATAVKTPTATSSGAGSKTSLSEMFKKDKQWTCNACYVSNGDNLLKCLACQAVRTDGKTPTGTLPKSESEDSGLKASLANKPSDMNQSQSANNFGKMQFGSTNTKAAPILFGSKETLTSSKATSGLFDFSSKNPFTGFPAAPKASTTAPDNKQATAAPLLFGSSKTDTTTTAPVFGQKAGPSFAELATSSQPLGFGGGFKASAAPNSFMLFGGGQQSPALNKAADGEEGDEQNDNANPEDYEPQVDFKPLVKLAEVEVKTGEEDEEILFKARCKLYRFSIETKEWKEKGAGEIKILKHKLNSNSYRVLMRRDQIFKLCANHRILPEIKLEIVNEKQLRWMANDCSDGKVSSECLTVKFRHEDEAKQFKLEFEKAQEAAKNQTTSVKQENIKKTSDISNLNSLASSLKITDGSWNCDACLTLNKPDSKKCASCDQVKKDQISTTKENDFTIEKVVEATPEQKQKAKEFMLPDNFYLYLNKPPCKGCIGCAECKDEKD